MLNRALSLTLAISLIPAGAAFAVERKPKPRHGDRLMYADPERTPVQEGRFYRAPPSAEPPEPPASANGS
jgi:hypothetical protein